ncbi:hypothetical protein Tcan_00619, partial [Toxocara canis]
PSTFIRSPTEQYQTTVNIFFNIYSTQTLCYIHYCVTMALQHQIVERHIEYWRECLPHSLIAALLLTWLPCIHKVSLTKRCVNEILVCLIVISSIQCVSTLVY